MGAPLLLHFTFRVLHFAVKSPAPTAKQQNSKQQNGEVAASRSEIEFWLVSFAWLSLALLFLLTVSYHTVKASLANPVGLLRE